MIYKFYLFIFCILSFLFTSCGLNMGDKNLPEDKEKIRYVLGQTKKILEERYRVKCVGFGMAAMTEVKGLELYFDVNYKLTKEEARAMLIDSVQVLVQVVSDCSEIQPYLQKEGFSEKNVNIVFFIRDKGKVTIDPDLAVVGCYRGRLSYKTYEAGNPHCYKNIDNETYEAALALLEKKSSYNLEIQESTTSTSEVDSDIAKMLKL